MKQTIKNGILLFLICLTTLSLFSGCGTLKEVPINNNTSTILRDSLIIRDSTRFIDSIIFVPIPHEKVMDIISQIDTSFLETSVAQSTAYVDTTSLMIVHSLENKDTVLQEKIVYKDRYITETRVVYRDSIQVKEIPVEVEVIKTVYPKTYWYLLGFFILVLVYIGIRIYLKFKV
jgi:hypothetical protein